MPSSVNGQKGSSKPTAHTSSSSNGSGTLTGFLRRGTPKMKGTTSPSLQQQEGPIAWPTTTVGAGDEPRFQQSSGEGPETSSRGEGMNGLSARSEEASIDPSSAQHGLNMGRRRSVVSNSSMSQSPPSPVGNHQPAASRMNRNSLSSFASSSGSPLATASSFSDRTTIGDLSTASMPLLPGGSTSSRHHADSSSAASFSDASSVHSYPPAPRPRTMTSSTKGSHDGGTGLEGWKNWAREMEAASAPPDRVRRKGSMASDVPLEVWTSRSSTSSSQYGRNSSSSSSLNPPTSISYGLSSPAVSRTSVTASLNPLAPLRKRLARSLSSPRRAGVELQLLLELIDALETYVRSAESHPQQTARPPPLPSSSSSATASTSSIALDSSAMASSPTPTTPSTITQPRQTDIELLSEIRSLVKELVECVPDAQLCLTTGLYGPLAFPSPASYSTSSPLYGGGGGGNQRSSSSNGVVTFSPNWPVMPLNTTASMVLMDLRDSATIEWWPRRLARDCRGLLEEVGFALGNGGATSSQAQLYREGGSASGLTIPRGGRGIGEEDALLEGGGLDEAARSSLEEALGVVRAGSERSGVTPSSAGGKRDSKTSAARREELLVEGKKRWNAYRARQQAMPDACAEGSAVLEG